MCNLDISQVFKVLRPDFVHDSSAMNNSCTKVIQKLSQPEADK